jgi:hypothetical protein
LGERKGNAARVYFTLGERIRMVVELIVGFI